MAENEIPEQNHLERDRLFSFERLDSEGSDWLVSVALGESPSKVLTGDVRRFVYEDYLKSHSLNPQLAGVFFAPDPKKPSSQLAHVSTVQYMTSEEAAVELAMSDVLAAFDQSGAEGGVDADFFAFDGPMAIDEVKVVSTIDLGSTTPEDAWEFMPGYDHSELQKAVQLVVSERQRLQAMRVEYNQNQTQSS